MVIALLFISMLSAVVYCIGMIVLMAGEFVLTGWQPTSAVVGGSIAGIGGIVFVVSALVLIFTLPIPGRDP